MTYCASACLLPRPSQYAGYATYCSHPILLNIHLPLKRGDMMDDNRLIKNRASIRLALRLLESPMFTKSSSPIFRRADVPYSCKIDADWSRIALLWLIRGICCCQGRIQLCSCLCITRLWRSLDHQVVDTQKPNLTEMRVWISLWRLKLKECRYGLCEACTLRFSKCSSRPSSSP